MLLFNIDRKAYMERQMAPSHLTLSDLERSQSMFTHALSLRNLCILHIYLPVALDITVNVS